MITSRNRISLSPSGRRLARRAGLRAVLANSLAATLAACLAPAAGAAEAPVGQVSLLIGEARVVRKDGSSELLRRGAAILVGDRVETSANGHVHVRFIDNAAVSVRPESVLQVQAYRYDAQNPQLNEVRLNVEHGTSRSISGQATEVDKNRFRLNTPLAAIGVRGTDFVVQSSETGVRATVADGAIVVAALGAGCAANALGPCAGSRASVLSADMGRLMVELRSGDEMARLVPVGGTLIAAVGAGSEERVAAQRAADAAARAGGIAAAEAFRSNNNDRAAAELLVLADASLPNLNSRPDRKAQLAWGRYSLAESQFDRVSVPFALAGFGRTHTVGDGEFTLFRTQDASNPDNLLQSAVTKADLRLSRGQATFEVGNTVEAASIDKATLSIDFTNRKFATALALSSASGGHTELRVADTISANGYFNVTDAVGGQKVTGALSLDGKEAGYLFEKSAAGGLFKGKTLWGR